MRISPCAIPSRTRMIQHKDLDDPQTREVIVVGGGIAGLSAAIYLGRAQRDTLVIDSGHSMAKWEPVVENYLGFPKGVGGEELLKNGCRQAKRYEVRFANDEIKTLALRKSVFVLTGKRKTYRTKCLLLATGIFHLPPEIPGVKECLGAQHVFLQRLRRLSGARKTDRDHRLEQRSRRIRARDVALFRVRDCGDERQKTALGQAACALAGGIRNPGGTQTHHRRRTPQAQDSRARFRGRDLREDRLHFHHARRYFSHRPGRKDLARNWTPTGRSKSINACARVWRDFTRPVV